MPQPATHSARCFSELIGHLRELVIAQKAEHEGIQVTGNHAAQTAVRHPPAIRVTTVADALGRWGRTTVTLSRRAGAQRKGLVHPAGQSRLHFRGSAHKAKSISSFRSHECRHLGKGGACRPPLCEGGALTPGVTPSALAGKLSTSCAVFLLEAPFLPAAVSHALTGILIPE